MISQDLQAQLETLIEKKGMKLYDIEFLKENDSMILRISLFKQSGITLDDCEMMSTLISPILDVALENEDSYFLEVSSPGIERTLKTPTHFLCSIGEKVEIKLNDKTILKGILKSYNNETLEIIPLQKTKQANDKQSKTTTSQDTTNNDSIFIPLQNCKKIKTLFEWESYKKDI